MLRLGIEAFPNDPILALKLITVMGMSGCHGKILSQNRQRSTETKGTITIGDIPTRHT